MESKITKSGLQAFKKRPEKLTTPKPEKLTPEDRKALRQLKTGERPCNPDGSPVMGEYRDEMFFFRSSIQGEGNIAFDIRAIKNAVLDNRVLYQLAVMPLPDSLVEHITKNGGCEEERVKSLTLKELRTPTLTALFMDNDTLIIDGNNRLMRRALEGFKTFRTILLPYHSWRPYSYWAKYGEIPADAQHFFDELPVV